MKNANRLIHALAGLALTLIPSYGEVIFSDNFDGAATGLNAVAPDQRPGTETWVSSNQFNADGTFEGGPGSSAGGSATLAFTPVQGLIYTLDTSVTLATINAGSFLGFGFADGQSTTVSSGTRFNGATVPGRAWSFYRNNTNNASAFMDGTASGGVWTNWADTDQQAVDMRIVLDTTGGAGNWTATWFYKYPEDESYIEARATTALLTESITSVGFCVSGDNADGTIHSFTLSDNLAPTPPQLVLTNPADGAIGVSPDANLIATFNKPIQLGASGDFTIRNLTTSTDTVISLPGPDADGTLTIAGSQLTIDPAAVLGAPGDELVIEISAGAIESTEALAFGGLLETDDPNWSFTIDDIPPTPDYFQPISGSDQAPLDGALFMTFDESPLVGSGSIEVYQANGTLVESIDVIAGNVFVNDTKVIIIPTVPLDYGTSYYVLIDNGAFTDELGNGYGISDPATWTFTTIAEEPAMLFGDSFNREDAFDLSESSSGKYGSLGALNYVSRFIGVGNVELSSGQLLIQSNENNGNSGALVYLDHNFTDSSISSSGGFSITVDISAYATNGTSRYMSVAVGQSPSELDSQTTASASSAAAGDLVVGYRDNNSTLFVLENGISTTTSDLPSPPTKMRIDYSLSDFNVGSTVDYEVFFDDSSTAFTSGSFTWSGTDENYISLSSNLIFSFTPGIRHSLFDNLQIRSKAVTGTSAYDTWANGEAFEDDKNRDGVSNGVAFLLGAANPDEGALGRLPASSQSEGLMLTFDCLAGTDRGDAVLSLEYSSDLGVSDAWTPVVVPGVEGGFDDGNVHFEVTANGELLSVVATISPAEAVNGKLFSRIKGTP